MQKVFNAFLISALREKEVRVVILDVCIFDSCICVYALCPFSPVSLGLHGDKSQVQVQWQNWINYVMHLSLKTKQHLMTDSPLCRYMQTNN